MHSGAFNDHALDQRAVKSLDDADLLSLDGPQHSRIRRAITRRFSVRAVREYAPAIREIVGRQLAHLRSLGMQADLTEEYAVPISVSVHCLVLGIPESFIRRFYDTFVAPASVQTRFDFVRDVLGVKRSNLGNDVFSDLLQSDLTEEEVEGVAFVLLVSGRDSVAYMVVTAVHALLTNPAQLAALGEDRSLMTGAIEEFVRYGSMFLTVFPRTAIEDLEIEGVRVAQGQTVSVSPVLANRDAEKFESPDVLDIGRDASGHLGFSDGPHGCVGQQLARAEIGEAVWQLITTLEGLALVDAAQSRPLPFTSALPTYDAGSLVVRWDAEV